VDQLYDRKYCDRGLFEINDQLWVDLAEMTREDVMTRCEVSFDQARQGYLVPLLSHTYTVHPSEKIPMWIFTDGSAPWRDSRKIW
jgi:hypothetical protein